MGGGWTKHKEQQVLKDVYIQYNNTLFKANYIFVQKGSVYNMCKK